MAKITVLLKIAKNGENFENQKIIYYRFYGKVLIQPFQKNRILKNLGRYPFKTSVFKNHVFINYWGFNGHKIVN